MNEDFHKKSISEMNFLVYDMNNYIIDKKEINKEAKNGSVVILGTLALMSVILFIFLNNTPIFVTLLVLFGLTFIWFTILYISYIRKLYDIRKEIIQKTELMKSIIKESKENISNQEILKYYNEINNQDLNTVNINKIIIMIKELKKHLEVDKKII